MKRLALIAAASFVSLASFAAGTFAYLKREFIFSRPGTDVAAAHGLPSYTPGDNEETQARKDALNLVEQLGAVQDRIIRGDRMALGEQRRLLDEIARKVRSFGTEEWSDYVNVRTSLLYVLSGGDANVLRPLVERKSLSVADQKLSSGIMSFAEGQPKKARELFEDIDPRSLDVSLVGPFALARASLYLEDDPSKAIALLDDARLACPHTAIDEASARREIPILLDVGDTARAMMLATSYVREFGRSIYAWKLFRDFAESAAKREDLDNTTIIDQLVGAFDQKDMRPASELFIDVAAEALLQGHLKLAKAAADAVLNFEGTSSENREKAQLYAAAAEAPSDDAANAIKALGQITVDRLSDEDAELHEVAGFIAHAVVGKGATAPEDLVAESPSHKDVTEVKTVQGPSAIKATAAINKADAILKRADFIISGGEK